MEKNKLTNLTGDDLDKLINRAFLNLDLEQPANQKLAESLGYQVVAKTDPFAPFTIPAFTKLILFILVCVLADGLALYFKKIEALNITPSVISVSSSRPAHPGKPDVRSLSAQQNKMLVHKRSVAGRKVNKIPAGPVQESAILTGYVRSFKSGEALSGAVIYKQNSDLNALSASHGYYSLSLPKGENIIVVSLVGYQTYTFSVYPEGNISRDIELKEVAKLLEEVFVKPEGYIFPNLTEKQKRANEKEKRTMARMVARAQQGKTKRAEKYPFILPPSNQPFAAFNMGSAEVTNLEYRTFLFDLLINGKKEEFLAAKPEQMLWHHAAGQDLFDTLAAVYFSEKKYDFYPAVNIPLGGAEMYCSWLSDQANQIRRKENKTEILVRLPYEHEWLYAASSGRSNAVYSWPLDSVQNRVNWFMANLCIQKQTERFKYPLGHPPKGDLKAYTSAGMVLGNRHIATVEAFSYNPNDFYLYGVCGNASEIVYKDETKIAKTKGGNWNSDPEHLKLNSEDEFETVKPSPMIGFRVCIVPDK